MFQIGASPAAVAPRSRFSTGGRCVLVADDGHDNISLMRGATVFEEENPLPGAQLKLAARDWNDFTRSSQCHAQMARHVVGTLGDMNEIAGVFRNQAVEESVQVRPRGGVGVFVDDQAGAGVLDEHRRDTRHDSALTNDLSDLIRDLVRPFPTCPYGEAIGVRGEIRHKARR